jgi:phosphonate transport system substrate-binding protein
MMERRNYIRALVLSIVSVFGPAALSAHTMTIGNIDDEPAYIIKKFAPLAEYLSRELRAEGFTNGKVVVAKNLAEMAGLIRERRVDLQIDSYVRALATSRLAGTQLVLRRWKRGVAEYHGLIFARNDSNIAKLEDLRGKTIAFDEVLSAVGYLLPKLILMEKGVTAVPANNPVGPRAVAYAITNSDENTMQWVLNGRVSAGAMDHQKYSKEARARASELKILHETPLVPRHVVSVRGDMPPKLLGRIKEILTGMDRSEEGRKILQEFEETTKFDDLTEQNNVLAQKLRKFIEAELKI